MVVVNALGFRNLFIACLRKWKYPSIWKIASLVLIPKPRKKGMGSPPLFRSICQLSEVGKVIERLMPRRVNAHLNYLDVEDGQYVLTKGISANKAICRVKSLSCSAVSQGGGRVALAVDLGTSMPLSPLPCSVIRRALSQHNMSGYLRNSGYLNLAVRARGRGWKLIVV